MSPTKELMKDLPDLKEPTGICYVWYLSWHSLPLARLFTSHLLATDICNGSLLANILVAFSQTI